MSNPNIDGIKFNIDVGEKLKSLINDKTKVYTNQMFYKYMFDYIPFDTGTLASTTTISGGNSDAPARMSPGEALEKGINSGNIRTDGIHFLVPYNFRIYFGEDFNFSPVPHPLATALWAQVAFEQRGDKLVDAVQKYIRSKNNG